MKTLELSQKEKVEGGSWSCIGGAIGMVGLGIALTTSTAGVGFLAWAGMMVSAFGVYAPEQLHLDLFNNILM